MSGAVPELRFTREDGSDYPDWEERKLGDICRLKSGDFVPAAEINEKQQDDLFRCYGGNGLRGFVTSYNKDGAFPLIGRQGALCGNVHLVSGKFHATEHAVVAEAKKDIIVEWLFYQLKQMNLNQYATGVAQPGLAVGSLINLMIDVPHHEEQKKMSTAKQKWAKGQRKMLPLWGWDNHRIDERQHPGSRACHIAGGCPDALARQGQSVLIGV